MRKFLIVAFALLVAACGEAVEVPNAHVGKILTAEGFRKNVIPPSKFRLDACWSLCDKLVLAEAADLSVEEQLQLWMPRDELNMIVSVRGIFAISEDPENVARIFDKVPSDVVPGKERMSRIDSDKVYNIYARQAVRNLVREELAAYSILQVTENRTAINDKLLLRMRDELKGAPITAMQFGLADVQPPEIIVKAKALTREKEVQISQAEAQKQIRLKTLEADLEAAEKDRAVRLTRARTTLEENKIISESITDKWLAWRQLEVMETMAENKAAVFYPFDMSTSTGLHQRLFQQGAR